MCNSGFQKGFLLQTIMNTNGEELITDAHESIQSAVMSKRRYHENICVQVHNSLYQGKLFEDD